ncbi:hypothetical protein EPH_0006100 [Eimeria praecox]|uniref:Uncharacterized protein n=1 Tax=Eimeria praecox TaxID=51316 RepID=U6G6E5_9EIME|nr:hypothetical protein EPH_0006100 [Eimeria praecox]
MSEAPQVQNSPGDGGGVTTENSDPSQLQLTTHEPALALAEEKPQGNTEVPRQARSLGPIYVLLFSLMGVIIASAAAKGILQRLTPPQTERALEPRQYAEDLEIYEKDFKKSALELFRQWDFSTPVVKAAFARYFTPSSPKKKRPVADPLQLYKEHIDAMEKVERPDLLDLNRCRDYKLNLLLLMGVCGAATETLKALGDLDDLHRTSRIPGLDRKRSTSQIPPVHLLYSDAQFDTRLVFLPVLNKGEEHQGADAMLQRLLAMGGSIWSTEGILSQVHSYLDSCKNFTLEMREGKRQFMTITEGGKSERDRDDLQSIVRFLL